MKRSSSIFGVLLSSIIFLSCFQSANGQSATDLQLYKDILHMDSVMFDAFNTQNLNILKTVFAENLEFYHDKGGLTDYKTNMENFRRNFEMNANSALRRELVKGSLEVYPVPGYGAIETGIHRFIHTENGKELIGIYKFTHVWQYKDKEWKVTRVVSVGH
ncbi:protein of unknown function [Chitinophaga sp. CF118]|nr:protein of unknown function [Chitinophaga sp. CF118]